jgi:hypothetical protein
VRAFVLGLGLSFAACGRPPEPQPSAARYLVTASPINLGLNTPLCVAVDPADRQGVWWWEPGNEGCSSRSTGPGVFQGHEARVVAALRSAAIDVRFRIPLHVALSSTKSPFQDVHLVLEGGSVLVAGTGARVPTRGRNDLDIRGFQLP